MITFNKKIEKQQKKIEKLNKYYFIFNQDKTISFLNDVLNDESNENEFTFYTKKDYFIIYDIANNFNDIKYIIISYFKLNILLMFYNIKKFYYLHFKKVSKKNIINFNTFKMIKKQLKNIN